MRFFVVGIAVFLFNSFNPHTHTSLGEKVRLIKSADMKQMPWKNGGGVTSEIAIAPPYAQVGQLDFDWRVSLAKVEADGPFSSFPNYDRVLAIWSGKGLVVDDVERHSMQPFEFSGDKQIEAHLIAGPVKDFGAIFKRGCVQGEMKAHSLAIDEIHSVGVDGECFVLCAQGELRIGEFYLNSGEVVHESGRRQIEIKALERSQFLVLTLRLGVFQSDSQ